MHQPWVWHGSPARDEWPTDRDIRATKSLRLNFLAFSLPDGENSRFSDPSSDV